MVYVPEYLTAEYATPLAIDHPQMTRLCMNRIFPEPAISMLIASYLRETHWLKVDHRLARIRNNDLYRISKPPNFDAAIDELDEALDHVKEIVCYMKYLPNEIVLVSKLAWFLERLCRFKALRPFIAQEALVTVMHLTTRHEQVTLRNKVIMQRRLVALIGRLLQVDEGADSTLDNLLMDYKNRLIDQFLDAGLQPMVIDRKPYFFTDGCMRRLMHMNLTNRPSSRHYDKVPAFLAALSSKKYRTWGVHPARYTLADLQGVMGWRRWMDDNWAHG
jgi:hypothetical protein